jgi:hypothetical protein
LLIHNQSTSMMSPTRSLRKLVLLGLLSIYRCVVAEDWLEYGSIVASDAAAGGERNYGFGSAVAMSGTTMVVGDPFYDGEKGRAYFFSLNVDAFEEDAVLDPEETTTFFGYAVAVDDNTIVVGAFGSNAAFVFVKNGGGEWSLQQKLTPSVAGGQFGVAVAVDGDRVVVGAYMASNNVGAAYVFERSGTTWNETMTLTPSDNPADGQFGSAVDLEGDAIVVAAPWRQSKRGAIYVFALNEKEWNQTNIVTASDGASGDNFGASVALSGSSIAVGALSLPGKAYVFTRSFGSDFEEKELLQGDATGQDNFGRSVALFGNTAVVGAIFHGLKGATYVYQRDPVDHSWSLATKLTSSESNGGTLGSAVAISGEFVAAGDWQSNLAGNNAGAVFVFVEEDPDTQPPSAEPSQSSSVVSEPQLPTLLALVLGMFLSL